MKIDIKEFAGKIKPIRDNDVYSVHDLQYLEHLNVSMTILHPGKATMGHSHEKCDEVTIIMDGKAELQMDDKKFEVETGDILLVKGGVFHKFFNNSGEDVVILNIFEKYSGRGGEPEVEYAEEPQS